MSSRSSSCDQRRSGRTDCLSPGAFGALLLLTLGLLPPSAGSCADAPAWMHALATAPLPPHKDTTDAVLLYSEEIVTVRPDGRLLTRMRKAYRILRPDGERLRTVQIPFDSQTRITDIRGWCIPVTGKDMTVTDKDTVETGLPGIANGFLVSDLQSKIMHIPGATVGSLVGWEVEQQVVPYSLNAEWDPQETVPV